MYFFLAYMMYKKKFLTCPQIAMVINPLKYHVQCTMRIVCKLFNCNCKPQGLMAFPGSQQTIIPGKSN